MSYQRLPRRIFSPNVALIIATAPVAFALSAVAASAQPAVAPTASSVFKEGPQNERIHIGSGFVCPDRIGRYVRDAVGESDLDTGSDFCSYYALDGVYGTVTLTPLAGSYDPQAALSSEFVQQEGTGAKLVGEKPLTLGPSGNPLKVYTRTYETAHLETLHYRIMFTGAVIGSWVLETTIEYADPRDTPVEKDFLDWAYASGLKEIGGAAK